MGSILVFGLATIALLPAAAIIFLFTYKLLNDLKRNSFEKKGNIVLSRDKIGEVLKDTPPSDTIQIFKSAICDHSQVKGIRYYTKFPFGLKIVNAHDNHRKAFIANKIGEMLQKTIMLNGDLHFCSDILICLTKCSDEAYYTSLIAWNSLSLLTRFDQSALIEQIGSDYMKDCIARDFLSGMGVLKFIFNIKDYEDLDQASSDLIKDLILFTLEKGDMPLLALLIFKLGKSPCFKKTEKKNFMKKLPNDPKMNNFLDHLDKLSMGFTKDEISEGLRNLGLQSRPYSQKTTEGEIVKFLVRDFIDEIYIPSSYMLHSFNSDDIRQNLTDFLWM